jgi:3-oxoacyl-[acyl-carrier protein] reductase
MSLSAAPLEGRTALVTGGARGLGRAYALRLAELGADVAIFDADLRSYAAFDREAAAMTAETTVDEVVAQGRRSIGIQVDVTDAQAMRDAVGAIKDEWGRLDILVCNAGGGIGVPSETAAADVEDDVFDQVLQRNLYGTVNSCRPAADLMRQQRWGRIVTVSSMAGRRAEPGGGYAHYGTAKAAIEMYSRYLAQQLGPDNITVNCIAPGHIGTGRLMLSIEQRGKEGIENSIPLRRIGTPEDCANVVQFLVTDLGDYVTGAVIPVDGGAVP